MESNMVNTFSNSIIDLVLKYFKDNFPEYTVLSKSTYGPHWAVKFAKGEIEINISGDIGFSIEIYIDSTKYNLWQYDKSVNETMKTNDKNILYQLSILKSFLSGNIS